MPHFPVNLSIIEYYNQESEKQSRSNKMSFRVVDEILILQVINSIKTKSTGYDNLSISTIRLCLPYLLPYITHIINFCIQNSVFPSIWKIAKVIPLPKISNPVEFAHLRPISLLPTLSKILERILQMQLQEYIDKESNLIPIHQSGFRRGHSCSSALLNITDDIFRAQDNGKLTVLVLLDYSKAFDSLDHSVLESILKYIGLSGAALSFISSYLKDRQQFVTYKGLDSQLMTVGRGVPQGSILSPTLFSIYISHFPSVFLSMTQHYYADDSQIYLSFHPEESHQAMAAINYDLYNLNEFSKNHCIQLNSSKSFAVLFGRGTDRERFLDEHSDKLNIGNNLIEFKEEVRNLGLVMDSGLRFSSHVNKCLQRAYCGLKMIYQIRYLLTQKTKSILCGHLVLSQFTYCDTVYGSCLTAADAGRIQRMQNSCLRLIFGIRKYQRISHTLKVNRWLNMQHRRFLHAACQYHNIIINKSPPYLYDRIKFRTDVHNLNIRFKGTLTPPIHRTETFKRSFSYQITYIYNQLPSELKTSKNVHSFKKQLIEVLFNKQMSIAGSRVLSL